jgi:hypothetical protein
VRGTAKAALPSFFLSGRILEAGFKLRMKLVRRIMPLVRIDLREDFAGIQEGAGTGCIARWGRRSRYCRTIAFR